MSYTDKLTALSTSIKSKAGLSSSETLSLVRMKEIIDGLSSGVDASIVTATAADCLNTKKILLADGSLVSGTIATKSGVTTTLSKSTTSYTIPAGYYSSTGKVSIVSQTKTVTPSSSSQSITADSGKVLTGVTVGGTGLFTKYTGSFTASSSSYVNISLGTTYSSSGILVICSSSITLSTDSYGSPSSTSRIYGCISDSSSSGVCYAFYGESGEQYGTYNGGAYLVESIYCTRSGSGTSIKITAGSSSYATAKFSGSYKWFYFG